MTPRTTLATVRSQIRNLPAKWSSWLRQIEQIGDSLTGFEDADLRRESRSLQYRARSGESLNELLPSAFALVRQTAKAAIGMSHYHVQLVGGIAMFCNCIAVMQTGEGKTLTATLPLYLHALVGKGCHLATANDYLAKRDADLMRPIFESLGVSVGVVQSNINRQRRHDAYHCDITYATAKEIGFDFLRDRLQRRRLNDFSSVPGINSYANESHGIESKSVQRNLHSILVDEADSILIDEATTPLIVSSNPDEACEAHESLYRWAASITDDYDIETDCQIDLQRRTITLTSDGRRRTRKLPKPPAIGQFGLLDIYDHVEQALQVKTWFQKDRHYVVRDGEVVIVDEFTGRLAEGRKWRDGLHQAIEARENLEISFESGEAARVTIQDLMLKYRHVGGMTGTVANSGSEIKKIYSTKVCQVPTNKPPQRKQLPDSIHGTDELRWNAIVEEVESVLGQGRPLLIGTRSIDKSEFLSKLLSDRGIDHQVLNARHLEREAEIISEAGQTGKVTVATNMAGRGTDIKLSDAALASGGLHVICSELHDSARIDRQLIGRSGRQGDPGSYRQYMSLDDDVLKKGLGEQAASVFHRYRNQSSEQLARLAPVFRRAQAQIEQKNFKSRKLLLYHDRQRQKMQREMGQDPYLDSAG